MNRYIYVKDKRIDNTFGIKRIILENYNDVKMTVGEKIGYNGKEIEVTYLVVYQNGYTGKLTKGVTCSIIGDTNK